MDEETRPMTVVYAAFEPDQNYAVFFDPEIRRLRAFKMADDLDTPQGQLQDMPSIVDDKAKTGLFLNVGQIEHIFAMNAEGAVAADDAKKMIPGALTMYRHAAAWPVRSFIVFKPIADTQIGLATPYAPEALTKLKAARPPVLASGESSLPAPTRH